MASVTFNDGSARTLTNSAPVQHGRQFQGWVAQPVIRAATRMALAGGARHVLEHRMDWRVTFAVPFLNATDLQIAQYLIAHLQRGGTCTLNTLDAANRI